MLVSFASGVSTNISLCFHTSLRIPWTWYENNYESNRCIHHVIPGRDNWFHIQVARKESYNAIWDYFAIFDQNAAEVTDDSWVISDFKPRTDCYLVTTSRYDLQNLGTAQYDGESRTNGRNALRVSVMGYVSCRTGVNWSIFGYISRGEIVPDVITTLLKRSKTGLIAREGSRHLRRISGENQIEMADGRKVENGVWHRGVFGFKWL
jgi:hypothetical protein